MCNSPERGVVGRCVWAVGRLGVAVWLACVTAAAAVSQPARTVHATAATTRRTPTQTRHRQDCFVGSDLAV